VTLPNLMPGVPFRPLSDNQTEPRITPRILVYHTMVGYLKSTENYFKNVNGTGFSGPESHFGVGGSWDGDALDGQIWQWQGLLWQADAQFDPSNNWCTSVETSDGGIWKPKTPEWSDKQIVSLIKIGAFWCKGTGIDPVVAKSYDGRGLGYHQLFREWNTDSHNCPGPLRVAQFYDLIVPGIAKALGGEPPVPPKPTFPQFPLGSGQWFGAGGVRSGHNFDDWQRQMRNRGWSIGVDGVYGPESEKVARLFQREKGLVVDALVGKQTWNAAWLTKIT
jgi:peptidoglycan hydrolase-like protein with peptidoglycan-binding domain